MLKIFSKTKSISADQQRLFFFVERIVNIAIAKTERGDIQSVIDILKDLEDIFKKFWQLKKENPAKFETLLWSKDFYEGYVQPIEEAKVLDKDDAKSVESAELQRKAADALFYTPERQLKGLTQFLNSFNKVWEYAYKSDKEEISNYIVYQLIWLLEEVVREPSNILFVEQFLKLLNEISVEAINRPKETDVSASYASVQWYIHLIFGREPDAFDLTYLGAFNRYLLSSVQRIISQDRFTIFNYFILSVVDGIHIPSYKVSSILDYGLLVLTSNYQKYEELKADQKIEELASSAENIDTVDRLNKWLDKFNQFKNIIEPHITQEQKEEAERLKGEINDYVFSRLKYNNLLTIIFFVGGYCIYKKRPNYIKYMWEYKQPPDSDASWAGHDIFPDSLENLIKFYFKPALRRPTFWDGHHGSEIYLKEYFLLMLARLLQPFKSNPEGKFDQIENFKLPALDDVILSNLEYSIDNLVDIAKELKKQEDIVIAVGFDKNELDELFELKIIYFLTKLKQKAQDALRSIEREQKISPKKIEEFREAVVKGFKESAIMRDILVFYKLFEDKTDEEYTGNLGRFGGNLLSDKAAFFEKWHVRYVDWGIGNGQDIAQGENRDIEKKILNLCKRRESSTLDTVLGELKTPSDFIIVTTNATVHKYFEGTTNFKPSWRKETPLLNVKGFAGSYVFKSESIPVFRVSMWPPSKRFMILNTVKMGKLVQYSPLKPGEDKELKKDIFYINVRAYSENNQLLEEVIKGAPEWLKEKGDVSKQKEYLREKVLIHIFERYEYTIPTDFEGYLVELTD